jgi:ABC-2 type transport system ATP-binding protein
MSAAQILARGLGKDFGGRKAMNNIDLALGGGLVTVLGPNGAGKTTLLRCLATVLKPDTGSLLIDGLDPVHESDRIEIRRRLGYLPQEPGLARSAKVFDLVDYMAVLKEHTNDRRRRHLVFDALERVGLADRCTDKVSELSGGMRQRLGVAQALVGSPTLLLLDEPAAGLDPDERFRLREIIAERRHHTAIVQSTHLTEEAAISDIVLVMSGGEITFNGTPAALAQNATGRAWVQADQPVGVRASWRQTDGTYRCLGTPPVDATLVEPTLEDGYLLLSSAVPI